MDQWTALSVIDALEGDFSVEAAHVRAALARQALEGGRSKGYPAALRHLSLCREALIAAGRAAEWETLADQIRREHGRKWSFIREFDDLAPVGGG